MGKFIRNLSVDCVIFGFDYHSLNVLLNKRELKDPVSGKIILSDYTVQGHHVLEGENVGDAAKRVLKDKTGLDNIFLKQFYTFGDVNRISNPRDILWRSYKYPAVNDHVISVGYYSLVDSTKVLLDQDHPESKWFPVKKLPELGYDHKTVIEIALSYLRDEISRKPIIFELLPEKFTLSQLQRLYETILNFKLDKRNFRKKVAKMRYIIEFDKKLIVTGTKPAQLYFFSQEVYEKTNKEKVVFLI